MTDLICSVPAQKSLSWKSAINTRFKGIGSHAAFARPGTKRRSCLSRNRLRTWPSLTRFSARANPGGGRVRDWDDRSASVSLALSIRAPRSSEDDCAPVRSSSRALESCVSNDTIAQWRTLFETPQVIEKDSDLSFLFRSMAAGQVRRDEAVRRAPKWMIGRQRFWFGNVEVRRAQPSPAQFFDERLLIERGTASDVVDNGARFKLCQPGLTHELFGFSICRESINQMIGCGEQVVQV